MDLIKKPRVRKKPPGRKPGSKNYATLVKETEQKRILAKCGGLLLYELEEVLKAVVDKAKKGDMSAAKLILDRAVPAQRSIDATALRQGAMSININIIGDDHAQNTPGYEKGITLDTPEGSTVGERAEPAHWHVTQATDSGDELAPDAGQKGNGAL